MDCGQGIVASKVRLSSRRIDCDRNLRLAGTASLSKAAIPVRCIECRTWVVRQRAASLSHSTPAGESLTIRFYGAAVRVCAAAYRAQDQPTGAGTAGVKVRITRQRMVGKSPDTVARTWQPK
jgi:hypothetical protein